MTQIILERYNENTIKNVTLRDTMRQKPIEHTGVWDLDDATEKHANTTQWGMIGEKMYKGFPQTNASLPAGVYNISFDNNDGKPLFLRRDIKMDDIFDLKEAVTETMLTEIKEFWSKEETFKKMGFLHRRGYLLYGPQGTGKSSVVKQIMIDVVNSGGLIFLCENPVFFNKALMTLRQAEPDRQLVCIYEDIDAIIKRYGDDELLSILDGANMVDNVLNIATTNYPEVLDRRIIARPRRFDRVIKVDVPNAAVRREFFKKQLPKLSKKKSEALVDKTEGLSMAALSEVIISTYCLGNTMQETIEILNRMEDDSPTSSEFGTSEFGFNSSSSSPSDLSDD